MQFVADVEPTVDGALQIMYGIDGHRDLTETTRDELSGYAGAHPVRIGSGAFDQRQNDVFGAALDSILLHRAAASGCRGGCGRSCRRRPQCAHSVWQEPDQGIWEARGKLQHYVPSSRRAGWRWIARPSWQRSGEMERSREAAEHRGRDQGRHPRARRDRSRRPETALRDRRARRVGPARRPVRVPPPDDERLRATVLAIADELTENGYVLRYKTDETDDGLSGKEGTFLICSFWLVSRWRSSTSGSARGT